MRISVNRESPHYNPKAYRFNVFLDGEKLKRCVEACEESGTVWLVDVVRGRDSGEYGVEPQEWVHVTTKKHGKVVLEEITS
jgi:hypothetical protein